MGQVASEFTFSHEVFGEGFYMLDILVKRLSNSCDRIPVMVSDRLIDVTQDYQGEYIQISGQFRSYNRHEEKKNRLVLSVFAREISFVEEENDKMKTNQIFLDGYICKMPVYRKTPLGREIADMLVAVNRPYGKSDYIPCICWGRNARFSSTFEVGGHVQVWGRIQSRDYMKSWMMILQKRGRLMRFQSANWNTNKGFCFTKWLDIQLCGGKIRRAVLHAAVRLRAE